MLLPITMSVAENPFRKPHSRRTFLQGAGALLFLTTLNACRRENERTQLEIEDDISAAASVLITGYLPDDPNEHAVDQGAMVETNGELGITTIGHVLEESGYSDFSARILGIGTQIELNPDSWQTLQDGPDNEDLIINPLTLDTNQQQIFDSLLEEGSITPLTLSPADIERVSPVAVVIPEQGRMQLAYFLTQEYSPSQGVLTMISEQQILCEGMSGAPVLHVEENKVTNKMVGTVIGGPPRAACSNRIIILPNS